VWKRVLEDSQGQEAGSNEGYDHSGEDHLSLQPPNGLELSRSAALARLFHSRATRRARHTSVFARQPSRLQRVVRRPSAYEHVAGVGTGDGVWNGAGEPWMILYF